MDIALVKEIIDMYLMSEKGLIDSSKTDIANKYGFSSVYSLIAFKRQSLDRTIDTGYVIKSDEVLKPSISIPVYVSNKGNVFNVYQQKLVCYNERYLNVFWDKKKYLVHRLVAEGFWGASKLQVNHKNGDKHDNRIENLEYCTAKENKAHSINVLNHSAAGVRNGFSKLTENEVLSIYNEYSPRRSGCGIVALGQKYNVDPSTIHLIVSGKTWSHVTGGAKKQNTRKLSNEAINDIKANYTPRGSMNQDYFAKKYGVSKPTIKWAIRSNI